MELTLINANNKWVIIAVRENILCDTISASIVTNTTRMEGSPDVVDSERVMNEVKSTIDEIAELIKAMCLLNPGILVAIVEPLMRPAERFFLGTF